MSLEEIIQMESRHGLGRCQDFSESRRDEIFKTYVEQKAKNIPVYKIAQSLDMNAAYLYVIHQKRWFQEKMKDHNKEK